MNRKLLSLSLLCTFMCNSPIQALSYILLTYKSDIPITLEVVNGEADDNGFKTYAHRYPIITSSLGRLHLDSFKLQGSNIIYQMNIRFVKEDKSPGELIGSIQYARMNNDGPFIRFLSPKGDQLSSGSIFQVGVYNVKMNYSRTPSEGDPDGSYTLEITPVEDGTSCQPPLNSSGKYGIVFKGKCITSCVSTENAPGIVTKRKTCAVTCKNSVTGSLGVKMADGSCPEFCQMEDGSPGTLTVEGVCKELRTTKVGEGAECDHPTADYGMLVNETCAASCILPDNELGLSTPDGQCLETCKTRVGQLGVTGGKNDPCLEACITEDGLTGSQTANNTCAPVCRLSETQLGFFGPNDICLPKCITSRGQEGIRFEDGSCREAGLDDKKRMGIVAPDGTVRTYCHDKANNVEGYRDASGVCRSLTEGSPCTTSDNKQGVITDGYCVAGASATPTSGTTCNKVGQSCSHKVGKKTVRGKYVQSSNGCVCK